MEYFSNMSVKLLIAYIALILCCTIFVWFAPRRYCYFEYNTKTIKFRHFQFLFNESYGENRKSKKLSLKTFIFQLTGYILNFLAIITIIVCYCLNIDIGIYLACFALAEFIICFIFAVCNDSY